MHAKVRTSSRWFRSRKCSRAGLLGRSGRWLSRLFRVLRCDVVDRLLKPREHFVNFFLCYDQRRGECTAVASRKRAADHLVVLFSAISHPRSKRSDRPEWGFGLRIGHKLDGSHEPHASYVAYERMVPEGANPRLEPVGNSADVRRDISLFDEFGTLSATAQPTGWPE